MDATSRSKHESILTEDWVKLGYLPQDSDLNNNIHPIFQHTNAFRPTGHECIWPQYKAPGEYESLLTAMSPVFRLASNILQSPKSLDFLFQVAYSIRNTSRGQLSSKRRPCKEFGWSPPSERAIARQMTIDALRRLSHSLSFQIGHPAVNPDIRGSIAYDPDIKGTIAYTRAWIGGFEKGIKIDDVSRTIGVASRITINETYLNTLETLIAQKEDAIPQKMSLQLKLAMNLCHEIAHALALAVDSELLEMMNAERHAIEQAAREGRTYQWTPPYTDEPFYRDEGVAEIGDCWENQVFGGKITLSEESTSDPLLVIKWPSFLTANKEYPQRKKLKVTGIKYFVPRNYIQNLHRQAFWDGVQPDNEEALLIKKTIGTEYLNKDSEARSVDSDHVNWHHDDGTSRIDREGGVRVEPDPSGDAHANATERE